MKWPRGDLFKRMACAPALRPYARSGYLTGHSLIGALPTYICKLCWQICYYQIYFQTLTVTDCSDWFERASITERKKSGRTWWCSSKPHSFSRNGVRTILRHSWMCPLGECKSGSPLAFTSPKFFETKLNTLGAPTADVLCWGTPFEGNPGKGNDSMRPSTPYRRSGHM